MSMKGTIKARLLLVISAVLAVLVTTAMAQDVTFTKDVAPILERSCQNCHRPDSIAPMPLLTYEQVRPWARAIKQNVVLRNMPPWHIDPNIGIHEFSNSVSLSDAEIATIAKWVDAGAPQGNPADMPARSEEHTSELQSRLHLVCRLLLEKKKKTVQP